MPKLSDLLAEKAKAEIVVGGATVTFTYYVIWRERFSDDEWEAVLAAVGIEYLKLLLPRIVESWDISDNDGHAIPVSAEAIDQHNMPEALLRTIERRIAGSDLAGKAISAS